MAKVNWGDVGTVLPYGLDSVTGSPVAAKSVLDVFEKGQIGGERNPSSSTNNYDAVHEECSYSVFAPGVTTETVISTVPVFIYGLIGKVGVGTITLRDTATAIAAASPLPPFNLGVAGVVAFPAAIRFESGLTAQLGTATDSIVVLWRQI